MPVAAVAAGLIVVILVDVPESAIIRVYRHGGVIAPPVAGIASACVGLRTATGNQLRFGLRQGIRRVGCESSRIGDARKIRRSSVRRAVA